jgi:signal peptidase II
MKLQKKVLFFGSFLILLGLDALLKSYVYSSLPLMSLSCPCFPYGGIGLLKDFFGINFTLVHVGNQGAAWGVLASFPNFLWWLRLFIILFLILYLIFRKIPKEKLLALSLVLTGAIGNLLDRLFYGSVVDMFYFQFGHFSYPVFNLADSYITLGIIWFLFSSLKERKKDGT